jgi:hypothetical protein
VRGGEGQGDGKCRVSSTAEGIQMHGGVGMTDEYDIGLYYKRAQAAGEFWAMTPLTPVKWRG